MYKNLKAILKTGNKKRKKYHRLLEYGNI